MSLPRELAGSLQNILGIDQASEYISVVGEAIGKQLNTQYCQALSVDRLSASQVADVMVDLKHRIEGSFFIIEQTEDRIVLGNRACPFGELGPRPAIVVHDDLERLRSHHGRESWLCRGQARRDDCRRPPGLQGRGVLTFHGCIRARSAQLLQAKRRCVAEENRLTLQASLLLKSLSEHFWPREHRPLSLIEAQPYRSEQKGADRGADGYLCVPKTYTRTYW